MSAVGHGGRRRSEVAGASRVPAGEAARQRSDVGEPPELLCAGEAGAEHPAVELFACPAGEWPAGYLLGGTWSLADQHERRSPMTLKGWIRLGDDAVVDAYATGAARRLVR